MSTEDDGFNSKNWVWVPDNDFFAKGYITDYLNDGTCKVTVVNGNQETHRVVPQNQLENCNPAKFNKCDDMAELTHLNEPSVVYNLYLRYNDDMIYTYSGLFLVAINPYKALSVYDAKTLKKYHSHDFDKPPPHIFATAEGTYRNLLSNKKDQSILVTGESGAGKTENTKKIIQYLSSITPEKSGLSSSASTHFNSSLNTASPSLGHSRSDSASPSPSPVSESIDTKILQANPILESFGNAKTIKNNNSSRFGKFIRIFFSPKGSINGANIDYYLLEKSRVVGQSLQERNYHVFYQFLKGSTSVQLSALGLSNSDLSKYKYLSSPKMDIPHIDDVKEYNVLVDAFKIMGFSTSEIANISQLLAVILHLGNLDFTSWKSDNANFTESSPVQKIVDLLGITKADFVNNLVRPKVKAGREFVQKSKRPSEVKYAIDAFAKHLYEKLFQYIIEKINENLSIDASFDELNFIGVLDIAGFEIFEVNSFEQLCINYTNEKLQQFFNHHSFILEQSEYLREDIQWEFIDFGQDLQPTIDLIETRNPMGVLKILDEECVIPKSSDKSFMEKLASNFGNGKSKKFAENKLKSGFIIHHYAGAVEYNVEGWLQKNTDPVNEHVLRLMPGSSNSFVVSLFSNDEHLVQESPSKRGSQRLKTASQKHKDQLSNLMEQLERTEPHFVRCILPNLEKKANKFDKTLVLHQLRCNGVLEGIRITRAGYPNRMTFDDFYQRYSIINIKEVFTKNMKTNSELLLRFINLGPDTFKIGITKIFFKNGILGKLEELRDLSLKSIYTDLQSLIRGISARKSMKKKIKEIQSSQLIARTIKQVDESLTTSHWLELFVNIKPLLEESIKVLDSKEMNDNLKNVSLKLKDAEKSKSGLEVDNTKLREQIEKLEDEIISTTNLIKEKDTSIEKMKADEKSTSTKIRGFETKLAELGVLSGSLKDEKRSLEEKLLEKTKELKEKSKEVKQLQKSLEEAKDELSRLRSDLDSHQTEKQNHDNVLRDLKAEHESSREVLVAESSELKELNSQLEKDLKNHKDITSKNSSLIEEIEQLKQSISGHVSANTQKEREIKSIKSNHQRFENENSDLKRQLTESEMKFREVNSQLEKSHKELDKRKTGSEKINKEIESLRSQLKDVKQLEREIESKRSEEIENQKELRTLRESLNSANDENNTIRKSVEKLKVEIESINRAKSDYSDKIIVLTNRVKELESNVKPQPIGKENYPPDPSFVDDFANIKLKLNEQSAALRKEKFENRKLSEEVVMLKERMTSASPSRSINTPNRKSFAMGESLGDRVGSEILRNEIESLKQKLVQEEANSQRAEGYAIQLQKKLNKLQSTRGLASYTDYEAKYRDSEVRIAQLEQRIESILESDSTIRAVPRSDSFKRNSIISSSLNGTNQDFVNIYQDITKTLKSTREELNTAKSEILRLKHLLRESEDELYDAKRDSFRTSVSDYEEELALLKVNHNTLSSKNTELTRNLELYKKRSDEYYKKLELAESAVTISKRHEESARRELEETKTMLKLARDESRATQIVLKDLRKQTERLEETIQDRTFQLQQANQQLKDMRDKNSYYTSNYDNKEIHENYKEEIRTLHKELNFKMETETTLVKENKKYQLDLEDLNREKQQLESDYDNLLVKEDELSTKVDELEDKCSQLSNTKEINERKITSLTKQVSSLKELTEEITLQRDELLENKTKLENDLSALNHNYDETSAELKQSQVQVQVLKQHLENQKLESEDIKSELNQSKISTTNEVQDYQKLRKDILITKEENDSLKRVNKELGTKVHTLEEKLYSNEQLKYWETKVKDLTIQLDESKFENYESSKAIKNLERNMKELQIRSENDIHLIKKYNDENFDYQNKVNHYKSTIDILHGENSEKDLALREKEREVTELREYLLKMEREMLSR